MNTAAMMTKTFSCPMNTRIEILPPMVVSRTTSTTVAMGRMG